MLAALANGEAYSDLNRVGKTGKVRAVRAWFFQQGTGWLTQARYGARLLLPDGESNAISVSKIAEIEPVLAALEKATVAGELDAPLAAAERRGKEEGCPRAQPKDIKKKTFPYHYENVITAIIISDK